MAATGLYSVPQPRIACTKTNKCIPMEKVNNEAWGTNSATDIRG
jgi:hypothetical protein